MYKDVRKYKKIVIFVVLYNFTITAFPDVSGDLNNFFTNLGFDGNISSPSAYNSQAAGYYSGGSLFLRNRVKNLQIFHLDAPTIRSGCGGIDLFGGGFSFVNAQELTAFFHKIISNASAYSLHLALATEVPEIQHVLSYVQHMAQEINQANLNSCDMAEDLIGGLWPKTRASQQLICQDIGSHNNIFSDWAAARQKCSTGTDFPGQISDASRDPSFKSRVVINKNLVWSAIRQNGFLANDTELAEFFMSVSGTIIYDANGNTTVLYPLADDRGLIKALLYGDKAQIYSCGNDPQLCLKPTLAVINIDKKSSLNQKVVDKINELVVAVQNDTAITPAQQGFLNSVNIPILKFITVSLSLGRGVQALDLTSYSDLIAKDLLKQYMLEALQIIKQSITTGTDYTPEIKKQLEDQMQQSLSSIESIKTNSHEDLQDMLQLIQTVRVLETEVTSNMSDQLKDNLNFSGGST